MVKSYIVVIGILQWHILGGGVDTRTRLPVWPCGALPNTTAGPCCPLGAGQAGCEHWDEMLHNWTNTDYSCQDKAHWTKTGTTRWIYAFGRCDESDDSLVFSSILIFCSVDLSFDVFSSPVLFSFLLIFCSFLFCSVVLFYCLLCSSLLTSVLWPYLIWSSDNISFECDQSTLISWCCVLLQVYLWDLPPRRQDGVQ